MTSRRFATVVAAVATAVLVLVPVTAASASTADKSAARLSFSLSSATPTEGSKQTLSGKLIQAGDNRPITGAGVVIQARVGSRWKDIDRAKTARGGTFSYRLSESA